MDNPYLNLLCILGFVLFLIFLIVVWVFAFQPTIRKMKEPGTTGIQQLLYLTGWLASPLVAIFDFFTGLASDLLKLFGALGGVILIALALLFSPVILLGYLLFLAIQKASILGERLFQRTIDFPDRIEKRVTQILIRLGVVQKPPDSSNSG